MAACSGRDGVRLAYREVGEGRPLALLYGFIEDATLWLLHSQARRSQHTVTA